MEGDGYMMKLVVSDVDGTLLRCGEKALSRETFTVIRALKEKGVLFVVASGRPYANLKQLFGEVSDDIGFIASDGAFVSYQSEVIGRFPIERESGFSFMREIYMETEAEIALYGSYLAYMLPKSESFATYFRGTIHNHVESVSCMKKVPEEYLKIGIYHSEDVQKYAGAVAAYWDNKLHKVYISKNWMEYTAAGVHKGAGLDKLLVTFGIAPQEVLAFGDNKNDKEMLSLAGCSYAMSGAGEEIKALCGYETEDPVQTMRILFGL